MTELCAVRAAAISFHADPHLAGAGESFRYLEDALVVIGGDRIRQIGQAAALLPTLPPRTPVRTYENAIVSAGFVDTHVHYPQTPMIGAYGEQLLEWLQKYTFVEEQRYADIGHARVIAEFFLRELLRNGTTTAAVYCTVHPASVDAFFEVSERFNTRMVAGKVLMDRHAPPSLLDTVERGYRESAALIERWHGRGRQRYCITPRFAVSSTPAQLDAAGALWRENPDVHVQSHLSENLEEIRRVAELFPERASYLDVYAHAGLVGPRSIYAHGVHLHEPDFAALHGSGAALAHCPTSNLFLGSGLFRLFDAKNPRRSVRVGLGTDVGGGTSFSLLATLGEAYKIARLGGRPLDPLHAFWLATRGGAEALYLDDRIGSLEPGREADLVVLDLAATPLLAERTRRSENIEDMLFALMTLGDDRAVRATWIAGRPVYDRDRDEPFILSAG